LSTIYLTSPSSTSFPVSFFKLFCSFFISCSVFYRVVENVYPANLTYSVTIYFYFIALIAARAALNV